MTAFAVVRVVADVRAHFSPTCSLGSGGRGVPEAVFADRAAAEADRDRREAAGRRAIVNPFAFVNDLSTLMGTDDDDEFALALLDRGVPVPPEQAGVGSVYYDWVGWWATADLTDAQRDTVWGLLDKLRFYTVVETEFV